jgi:hypothetical protein
MADKEWYGVLTRSEGRTTGPYPVSQTVSQFSSHAEFARESSGARRPREGSTCQRATSDLLILYTT